jgi:hypothetical protein
VPVPCRVGKNTAIKKKLQLQPSLGCRLVKEILACLKIKKERSVYLKKRKGKENAASLFNE